MINIFRSHITDLVLVKKIITLVILILCYQSQAISADGKLLGTSGLVQVEGSGGGGLVPWASLSGLDSDSEYSISSFYSIARVQDYSLNSFGISSSFYDRLEVSVTKQEFEVDALNTQIEQTIYGVKTRIYGDMIYSKWPQISIGIMHKTLSSPAIANAVAALNSDHGTDYYLAATKVHLGLLNGYNLVWNVTTRATKANELGLLGFGGANNNDYKLYVEASAGIVFRNTAFGLEYRQKPDNLGLGEDDWYDVFFTYLPNKQLSFTLAYLDLGSIAGSSAQSGFYASISAQF